MREVFLLMKYNLTTLKIYFKQGRKFKFFCQIGLKYRKIVFKYWKYILNTLKSVSKYIWFGKGRPKIQWNMAKKGAKTLCFRISYKTPLNGRKKNPTFVDKFGFSDPKPNLLSWCFTLGKKELKIDHKMCPKFVEKYAWNVTNIS